MAPEVITLSSNSLGATLRGVSPLDSVWQFRNLQYATVPHRFADPQPSPSVVTGDVIDCTRFGPQCPQNHVDFRHLLRVPEHISQYADPGQDEFACLNLDITLPAPESLQKSSLPVLFWIHGGSQAVSFGDSASGLCDPIHLVARSMEIGRPMIVVNINYRLNLFALGDSASSENIALKDQQSGFAYVRRHIASFGGDKDHITIAGESAGAVYCHAHLIMRTIVPQQCILQSGTLALSPPQPNSVVRALLQKVTNTLSTLGYEDIRSAPASALLETQKTLGMVSFFLQEEEALNSWESRLGDFERIMIGDTEYESVLWRNGIEECTSRSICDAFDELGTAAPVVKEQYGIVADWPTACKLGALDFLNDVRFALPISRFMDRCLETRRPAFRFLVDQPNPWQSSSRAHHGVDLLYLFGTFSLSHNAAAMRVAEAMQERWINFISGADPWEPGTVFAFGPLGESRSVSSDGLRARRREGHMTLLREIGLDNAEKVVRRLAPDKSSLLN